jgi:plastocyanin
MEAHSFGGFINMWRITLGVLLTVATAACGSKTPTTPSPTPMSVSIPVGARTLGANSFVPNPVTVTMGSTVTWTNNDTIGHNTISDSGVWTSPLIPAGGTFAFTFQSKGTFPYKCTLHQGMVGTVVVQ